MERQNILDDQLRRVAFVSVNMPLIVESDSVIALGEQSFCPATEAAEKVDGERLAHFTGETITAAAATPPIVATN